MVKQFYIFKRLNTRAYVTNVVNREPHRLDALKHLGTNQFLVKKMIGEKTEFVHNIYQFSGKKLRSRLWEGMNPKITHISKD